jgi:hypothetical protein
MNPIEWCRRVHRALRTNRYGDLIPPSLNVALRVAYTGDAFVVAGLVLLPFLGPGALGLLLVALAFYAFCAIDYFVLPQWWY